MSNLCGSFSKGGYEGYCSCGGTGCLPYRGPKNNYFIIESHTFKPYSFYHPKKKMETWAERRAHLEGLRK